MSKRLLANGRGRWLALAMSLVVSAGMLYAQVHEPGTRGERGTLGRESGCQSVRSGTAAR